MSDTWLADITDPGAVPGMLKPDEIVFRDELEEWLRDMFCPHLDGEHTELPTLARKIAGLYLITECSTGCGWKYRHVLSRDELEDIGERDRNMRFARDRSQAELSAHLRTQHSNDCRYCGESTVDVLHVGCIVDALREKRLR